MSDNKPKYIDGVGWRYETEHSMERRMKDHDYQSRCIYMITMNVEGRQPLLGALKWNAADGSDARIETTPLGAEVERCWMSISTYYPEARPLKVQIMPDHIHGILFVKRETTAHLGQIVNGFKIGCNRAFRRLREGNGAVEFLEAVPHDTKQETGPEAKHPKHPKQGMLFETGYQDSVLTGKGQLENMLRYVADNPRRLAIKRIMPDLFKVVSSLTVGDITYAAIGNRWLLDRPVRMQARCHNNTSPHNLQLIERQKEYFLKRGEKGGVVVSPCISAGEKEIARAALDAGQPLIVILENGFAPLYKPPGKYFEACAKGLLLMLAPWPYHMDRRTITRSQCLALNSMAEAISNEPWTQELEATLSR
ncbi:MAG: hypothetical protein KBT34_11805 [Prevotella sp.]|nr:hypothetical protein [Candidatus Prevotella equi]